MHISLGTKWLTARLSERVSLASVCALSLLLFAATAHAEDLMNVIYQGCFDADTCTFDILPPAVLNAKVRIRFAGIDAPELHGKCEQERQLAMKARDFVKATLHEASVRLENVSRDKYYRIDAIVIADGVNVNELLIQQGYAVAYSGTGKRHDWCGP